MQWLKYSLITPRGHVSKTSTISRVSKRYSQVLLIHTIEKITLLISTSSSTRISQIILCTWMLILATCWNIPFYLGLEPLTVWMNMHMGVILLIRIPPRPPLTSSRTHITHSGNLTTIIMQIRSSPEPSFRLDNGSYSISITLSWIILGLRLFCILGGFHRVRAKFSCLVLQLIYRYSREIL